MEKIANFRPAPHGTQTAVVTASPTFLDFASFIDKDFQSMQVWNRGNAVAFMESGADEAEATPLVANSYPLAPGAIVVIDIGFDRVIGVVGEGATEVCFTIGQGS